MPKYCEIIEHSWNIWPKWDLKLNNQYFWIKSHIWKFKSWSLLYQLWFIAYKKCRLSMHSFQLSVIIFISLYRFINELKFYLFSLVVHPNKLLIATGQTTGHDRREGRVSIETFFITSKMNEPLNQCFSTRVPQNPEVPPIFTRLPETALNSTIFNVKWPLMFHHLKKVEKHWSKWYQNIFWDIL